MNEQTNDIPETGEITNKSHLHVKTIFQPHFNHISTCIIEWGKSIYTVIRNKQNQAHAAIQTQDANKTRKGKTHQYNTDSDTDDDADPNTQVGGRRRQKS